MTCLSKSYQLTPTKEVEVQIIKKITSTTFSSLQSKFKAKGWIIALYKDGYFEARKVISYQEYLNILRPTQRKGFNIQAYQLGFLDPIIQELI